MPTYRIAVQFAGTNQDRMNDEVYGVEIFPSSGRMFIPGESLEVDTGNFFHGVNPDNSQEQVFSIGGPGGFNGDISERARYEQGMRYKIAEAFAQRAKTNSQNKRAALSAKIKNLKTELTVRRHEKPRKHTMPLLGGMTDTGPNSTNNASKIMTVQVNKAIKEILGKFPDAKIELDIQGASRGGVAATKFARDMNALYRGDSSVSATLMLSDPVPGGLLGVKQGPFGNKRHDLSYNPTHTDSHNTELVKILQLNTPNPVRNGVNYARIKPDNANPAEQERYDRGIINKLGVVYSLKMDGPMYKRVFDPMKVEGADVIILGNERHIEGLKLADVGLRYGPYTNGRVDQNKLKDIPNGVYVEKEEVHAGHKIHVVRQAGDVARVVNEAGMSPKRTEIVRDVAVEGFHKHKDEMARMIPVEAESARRVAVEFASLAAPTPFNSPGGVPQVMPPPLALFAPHAVAAVHVAPTLFNAPEGTSRVMPAPRPEPPAPTSGTAAPHALNAPALRPEPRTARTQRPGPAPGTAARTQRPGPAPGTAARTPNM